MLPATVGVGNDDRPRAGALGHRASNVLCRRRRRGITRRDVPLDGEQAGLVGRREALRRTGAEGEPEQVRRRGNSLERRAMRQRTLVGREFRPRLGIDRIGGDDLALQVGAGQPACIAVGEAVGAELEQRVGEQLARARRMRGHPAAAHEQCRLHTLTAQHIDDGAVVTGQFLRLLAKVEGEGDEFLRARRQLDPADNTVQVLRHRRQRRPDARRDVQDGWPLQLDPQALSRVAGQGLGGEARRLQSPPRIGRDARGGGGGGQRAGEEDATNHNSKHWTRMQRCQGEVERDQQVSFVQLTQLGPGLASRHQYSRIPCSTSLYNFNDSR